MKLPYSNLTVQILVFSLKQTCTINEFNLEAAEWNETEPSLPQLNLKDSN